MWRITSHTCRSCNGTGRTHNFASYTSHVANPGNAPCFSCNSTGRIEKRVWVEPSGGNAGTVNIDASTGQVQADTRTPEQKRHDLEEAIATLLGLVLGLMIAGPLIWHGLIAWWVALGLGGAVWFGMYKICCGPMRIVAVLGRVLVTGILWLISLAVATSVVGAVLYIAFKIVTQNG